MKRALFITWAFTAAISLINLSGLWPLIVTPFAPLAFGRWLPFLGVPFGVAIFVAVIAFLIRRSAILVNVVFWIALFVAADWWSAFQRFNLNWAKQAQCVEVHGFLRSLTFANIPYQFDVHAAFILPDRVMLWSYAEMDYFEVGPNIYRNLDFTTCRNAVQALLEKTE